MGQSVISKITQQEDINFLLTNRLPRRMVTRFIGWFSKIRNPLVRDLSIAVWKLFATDLDLTEARKDKFESLHDCFIRELKPGARPIDTSSEVIVSPCDAIIGEMGGVEDTRCFQAKGFPYTLDDLLHDTYLVDRYRNGVYITLRLTSTMYHRFHAPLDCRINQVNYISGDTWNVNPIALKRIEKLFCKNERAVIDLKLPDPDCHVALVPVAAILVASIKLHCLSEPLNLQYEGPNLIECDGSYAKGEELGYFEHGSTIIVFARGKNVSLAQQLQTGQKIAMGQPLLIRG